MPRETITELAEGSNDVSVALSVIWNDQQVHVKMTSEDGKNRLQLREADINYLIRALRRARDKVYGGDVRNKNVKVTFEGVVLDANDSTITITAPENWKHTRQVTVDTDTVEVEVQHDVCTAQIGHTVAGFVLRCGRRNCREHSS